MIAIDGKYFVIGSSASWEQVHTYIHGEYEVIETFSGISFSIKLLPARLAPVYEWEIK